HAISLSKRRRLIRIPASWWEIAASAGRGRRATSTASVGATNTAAGQIDSSRWVLGRVRRGRPIRHLRRHENPFVVLVVAVVHAKRGGRALAGDADDASLRSDGCPAYRGRWARWLPLLRNCSPGIGLG